MAREVLGDAVRCGEGFAMAEVTSRTLRAFATILLMPAFAWVLTPRMRPFRWSRLLLTYLVPLIPLVVLWDGLVSCCRTRTPEELADLTSGFPQYEWMVGLGQADSRRPGRWASASPVVFSRHTAGSIDRRSVWARANPRSLRGKGFRSLSCRIRGGLPTGCERYEQDVFTLPEGEQRNELCRDISLNTLSRCFLSSGHELVNDFLEQPPWPTACRAPAN